MFCGLRAPSHTLVSVPTQVPFSCPAPVYGSACCWTRRSSPSSSSSSSSASCPDAALDSSVSAIASEPRSSARSARDGPGLRLRASRCFAARILKIKSSTPHKLVPKSIQRFADLILALLSYVGAGLALREAGHNAWPHPAGPQGGALGRSGAGGAAFPTRSDFRCAPRRGGAVGPGAICALHRGKMADREEALREFVAVTGAEEERARFFLESAGWDLQVAPFRAGCGRGCGGAGRCGAVQGSARLGLLRSRPSARRPLGPQRLVRAGSAVFAGPELDLDPLISLSQLH